MIGSKSTEDLIPQEPLKNLYFFDIPQPANERYITERQEQVMNLLEMTRKLIKKTGLGSLFYGLARPFASRGTLPDSATAWTILNDWSPDPDKSCFIANRHYEPRYDLSIIIPAFNVEKYITDCLMSVVSQQLADYRIEVIVVNDGSTDRTPQLLDSLALAQVDDCPFGMEPLTSHLREIRRGGATRNAEVPSRQRFCSPL